METVSTTRVGSIEYYSEAQTAEILSVKVATLRNWRSRRKGPPFTKPNGDTTVYPAAALHRYLEERTTAPNNSPPIGTLARPIPRRQAARRASVAR
jgi:Helix-turn-helix domain